MQHVYQNTINDHFLRFDLVGFHRKNNYV